MRDYVVVIPARLGSTRLDRKPLAEICGKPMIIHTYFRALEATPAENIFIATDSEEIKRICQSYNANVVMTSESCKTGTDRVAEFATKIEAKAYINLQGDEPLMDANNIRKVIKLAKENPKSIINGWTEITSSEEYYSRNIPKVAVKKNGTLMYMSRSPIPGSKNNEFCRAKKQVCVYSFPNEALSWLRINPSKTNIEEIEDIEILRFIESDWPVQMTELQGYSIAVDTREDLEKVRGIMKTELDSFKETISLSGT